MLETLPIEVRSESVLRFANPRDDVRALVALGLNQDSIDEMMQLLKVRAATGGIERLIDGSFEPWNKFGAPYGDETRFSDGSWPVCYTAEDKETAEDEIRYHRGKALFSSAEGITVYYHLVELDYNGGTVNLHTQRGTWPELTDPNEAVAYPFCQRLGREARDVGISGFLTPSARRHNGRNVPVFSRSALTNPRVQALAAFVVGAVHGSLNVVWD